MKKYILFVAAALLFSMCFRSTWRKTESGVIIRLNPREHGNVKQLKLDVVNDEIIRVTASPSGKISEEKSLIITENLIPEPAFNVRQELNNIILTTGKITVKVSLATGQIVFMDNGGNTILKEPPSGGRNLTPVSVEGADGYLISQVFESPDNESFYGLGQHQSDEFDYKGLNEVLYQYNTKVSVPFVISDRNYGILWDNYSLTKFGDPRDYSQIDLFRLSDENGVKGGLTADYYLKSDTGEVFLKRKESSIDYENLETVKNLPEKFPLQGSVVTWTGTIEPDETGIFMFRLYYAGYASLWIDNELIVPERWRTAWNPNTCKFSKNLEKGRKYPLKLIWKPDGTVSYIGLKVLSPRPLSDQGSLRLTSEMGDKIDYYFIRGNNIDDIIHGYRVLTGKAPIMPKWALGFWQSRERYKTQSELLDVIREYRKRQIPLDNIVLDWSYWPVDSWGSHEFDPEFFPDPLEMVNEVHRMNARLMISVWPKFYYTTQHYREFDEKGWMYRQAVKDSIRDWIGKGYIGSFYDAYSEGARKLFWEQIYEHLYTKGIDAWWMDASEPDILSNASVEYRKKLMTPTALGPSTKYFNAYPLVNAMAIYNGQISADPEKRVFILTRSGFAGLQRFSAATWSGDIGTRWEEMKAQIPAGLNYSLSGIPYWTFDIGGFCVENRYRNDSVKPEDLEEWRELNTRWFQFGSFCPLFRSHGQYPYREIYNIAPESHPAYQSMIYYDKLRYYLMPYIYSLAALTYFNDYTIMRAMVMDFGFDPAVKKLGDQYMFGPSILVAPVYKYKARSRDIYFPVLTGWYDLYSGLHYKGGQKAKVDAPYERMPVFVREGSIIPFGPPVFYTGEKQAETITLYIYKGRDCAFTLYEDEEINNNYKKGACSTIRFSYDNTTDELTISDRNGEFSGMLPIRNFNIIFVDRMNPVGFDPDARPDTTVRYEGKKIVVKL